MTTSEVGLHFTVSISSSIKGIISRDCFVGFIWGDGGEKMKCSKESGQQSLGHTGSSQWDVGCLMATVVIL